MTQLDAASGLFLDAMRAAGGKPLYEQTVEEAREGIRAVSAQLSAPRAELYQVADRRIGPAGAEFDIRIYTPRPPAGRPMPIVVHFHGGGFAAGDLDTHDAIARHYSKHADAVVVAVDYRRPPEHPFPAAVDDAYAAVEWAAAHAGELDGDAERLAVTGDSAGGNLSAVVCQLARDRRGPRIAYQALVYPTVILDTAAEYPSRVEFGRGDYFLSVRDLEWFRSLYLTDAAQASEPRASPILTTDLSGLPPALVITSGCDLLRDEGKAYADRLAAAGVPVEYRCFEGTVHACMSFAAAIPAGLEALSFVSSRLRAALQ